MTSRRFIHHHRAKAVALFVLIANLRLATPALAADDEARFFSGPGNVTYLALGMVLPAIEGGPNGEARSLRAADAVITATLLTQGLKRAVGEKRPDGGGNESFPSGHAAAAFAVAAMQAEYDPEHASLWYLGAGAIGASRVQLNRHYIHDVVAGAFLGYVTARWELSSDHGLVLSPILGDAMGVAVTRRF